MAGRYRRGPDAGVVEDRILRRAIELIRDYVYTAELQTQRDTRFGARIEAAANDAVFLAPWLEQDAA